MFTSTSTSTRPRIAGPLAVATGVLMIIAQLVMWPFDTEDHVTTSQDVVFQLAGVAYFIAFCMLLLTLLVTYLWEARDAGRLGVIGVTVAAIGTMALGGDLWFETFAVPWLADKAPAAFDTDPTTLLALGAISSYLLFAVGWILFGVASLRADVFPKAVAVAVIIGGIAGYAALLSPFGIPLGLAVAWLGVWMIRASRTVPTTGVEELSTAGPGR